jgi:hypothetical protein
MLIPRLVLLGMFVVTLCGASPAPSQSAPRKTVALQLESGTPEHPAAASIRMQRFLTMEELKAHINSLPPDTGIRLRWWTDPAYKENPFFIARDELRKFCEEKGRKYAIEPEPLRV